MEYQEPRTSVAGRAESGPSAAQLRVELSDQRVRQQSVRYQRLLRPWSRRRQSAELLPDALRRTADRLYGRVPVLDADRIPPGALAGPQLRAAAVQGPRGAVAAGTRSLP